MLFSLFLYNRIESYICLLMLDIHNNKYFESDLFRTLKIDRWFQNTRSTSESNAKLKQSSQCFVVNILQCTYFFRLFYSCSFEKITNKQINHLSKLRGSHFNTHTHTHKMHTRVFDYIIRMMIVSYFQTMNFNIKNKK